MKKIVLALSVLSGVYGGATAGVMAQSDRDPEGHINITVMTANFVGKCVPLEKDPKCCIDENGNMICS